MTDDGQAADSERCQTVPLNGGTVIGSEPLALLPSQMPAHPPLSGRIAFQAASPANEELSSDEALVLGIRRGDLEVGRRMYRRVIRVVEAALRRVMGRDEPDHEDLIQSVFEEIVSTIHSGRFAMRCSLTSWAASIACHVGLNAIRERRMDRRVFDRAPTKGTVEGAEAAATPRAHSLECTLEARDELRHVRVALAGLIPERAEAVLLHDVMGYAVKELAEIAGVSVAAAQSRLARGRADLSLQLANSALNRVPR